MSLPAIVQDDAVIGLVRKRLLEVAEIQALVGGRIVGGLGEHADYGTLPKPAISILLASDRRHYTGVMARYTVELFALSNVSQAEARTIYGTLAAALQAEGLASEADATRGLMTEQGGRRENWWETSQSWYCTGVWSLSVVRDR